VADRGRAAPVDMERPANGTRWGKRGSNPRGPLAALPVDDVLPDTPPGCYVPGVRDLSIPRSHQGSHRTVSRVTRPPTVLLTCRNSAGTTELGRSGRPIELVGPGRSQLVDNSVERESADARCEPQDNGEK
jgi:hypothetical protein